MARPEVQISGNHTVPGELSTLNSTFKPERPRLMGDNPLDSLKSEAIILPPRKETETSQSSEAVLEAFFMNTISAAVILDRDYNILRANAVFGQRFAGDAADLKGHNLCKVFPAATRKLLDEAVQTKKTYTALARPFEYPGHPEWGVTYWDWKLVPLFDAAGAVDLLILSLNDVTEHVQVQEELTEIAECYLNIIDYAPDGVLLAKPDGTVLSANQIANICLQKNASKLRAAIRKETVDRDDPKGWQALPAGTETVRHKTEMLLLRPDGSQFPAEVTIYLFRDRHDQLLSGMIIQDMTKWKKSEAALRASEEKYSKAFYNNQMLLAIARLEDRVLLEANDAFLDMSGYQREEIIGQNAVTLLSRENPASPLRVGDRLLKEGKLRNVEIECRKNSGEIGHLLYSFNLLELGGVKCILGSGIDITELKKIRADLLLSEARFYKTFNFSPLSMLIISINSGTYLEINDAYIKRSGYTREDLVGVNITEIKEWADYSECEKFLEKTAAEGFVQNFEAKLSKKSGEIITCLISGAVISWQDEECILAIVNDITELKRYESELARLDRLNLIGQMAAGIGHEIRNPMTTVRGFLQLMMQKDRYAPDLEIMELMIAELDRANAIITEFLALAKTKPLGMNWQSLNQKIRNIFPLIQAAALKQDKSIELELGNIPQININRNEIHQLVLNLVYNGLEAMSPGGCLTIKTYKEADGVTLAVKDQGGLMPLKVLEKLGTPFFTTKDRGTGLGLAVCYNIAERHDAVIDIENDSAGTTFFVRFKE